MHVYVIPQVLGERIPYVMIKGYKGAKAFEKAEDPLFVLENNIPIDSQWYVEHPLIILYLFHLTKIFQFVQLAE